MFQRSYAFPRSMEASLRYLQEWNLGEMTKMGWFSRSANHDCQEPVLFGVREHFICHECKANACHIVCGEAAGCATQCSTTGCRAMVHWRCTRRLPTIRMCEEEANPVNIFCSTCILDKHYELVYRYCDLCHERFPGSKYSCTTCHKAMCGECYLWNHRRFCVYEAAFSALVSCSSLPWELVFLIIAYLGDNPDTMQRFRAHLINVMNVVRSPVQSECF